MIRFLLFLLILFLAGYSTAQSEQKAQSDYCPVFTGETTFTNSTFYAPVIVNPQGTININATMAAPEEEMKLIKEFIQLQISLSEDPLLEQMSFEDQLKYINRKTKTYKTERLKLEAAREGITLERKNAKKAQEQLLSNMKKQNDEIQTLVEENAQKIKNPSLVKELKASAQKAETIYTSTQACVSNDYEVIPIQDTKTGEIVYGFSLEEIRRDPNYVLIDDYQEGFARVKRNNKFGFYNDAGALIIPFKYDYAESFSGGLALVQNLGEWFLIDQNEERLYTLHEKNSYGEAQYITIEGRIYRNIKGESYRNNYVRIENGEMVRFRTIEYFDARGVDKFEEKNLWGLLNWQGQVILPPKYRSIENNAIFEGYCLVQNENYEYGILDGDYEVILPVIFKNIEAFENSHELKYYSCTGRDYKIGLYHLDGFEVLPPIYDEIKISSNYLLVRIGNKYGLHEFDGKEILPSMYNELIVTSAFIRAKRGNKYGLYSFEGKELIACQYDDVIPYAYKKEGIIRIINNGQIGFTDVNGNILLSPAYKELKDFKGERMVARIKDTNGLWGLISQTGEWVISCQFNAMYKEFYPGFYEVQKDSLFGLVDNEGRILFPAEFKRLDYFYFDSSGYHKKLSSFDRSHRVLNLVYNPQISNTTEIFICLESTLKEHKYSGKHIWRFNPSTRTFDYSGKGVLYHNLNYKLSYWSDNFIQLYGENNTYIFDSTFKIVHSFELDDERIVDFDKNGHLMIRKGEYASVYYLTDNHFKSISDEYEKITSCENGMYLVYETASYPYHNNRDKDRYGYLNNEGQLAISIKYKNALPFEEDNRAIVKQEEKWGVIDQYGAEIIIPAFERIERTSSGFRVHFNDKKVFDVDRNGKCTSRKAEQYNDLVKAFHNK